VKVGQILAPQPSISWMSTFTGPSFARYTGNDSNYELFITGRDSSNRSIIGTASIDLNNPIQSVKVHEKPVFEPGELGAFDENGVSYPWIVSDNETLFMYYVGWMPTKLTPFQNHTGLAISKVGNYEFIRASRAPILSRTNEEPFCSGSVCVLKENIWKMWYTSFIRWGVSSTEHKHYYVIKYAESHDGLNWLRDNTICINFGNEDEYAIGKPSVIHLDDGYHMWYVYRGQKYRIGYAHSQDGKIWQRMDNLAGISVSDEGWDSVDISYPHVFRHEDHLYMLYCGNGYGKEGLGLAIMSL